MTKKLKEHFSNINKLSKNIIKYGSLISYLLIITGICMFFSATDTYSIFVAQEFIKSSVSVFSEVIIGGLFFDLLIKMNNHN